MAALLGGLALAPVLLLARIPVIAGAGFWACAWGFDVAGTRRAYVRDRAGFPKLERSVFLSALVPRFGFWGSAVAILLAELLILSFLALGPLSVLSLVMLGSADLAPALSAGLVLLGALHLGAALGNRRYWG